MKSYLFSALAVLIMCGCNQPQSYNSTSGNNYEANESTSASSDKLYTYEFKEYGFSLEAPCEMKDVSAQSSGDFLINYGGIADGNNPEKMAAYQLSVIRMPVGYKNYDKDELATMIDEQIKLRMSNFKNVEHISFGYEGYNGYVGETSHQGLAQKGVIFSKDNLIIALTVLSNDDLNSKFNKFTNGFKSLDK